MDDVGERIERVRMRIARAAHECGREPAKIRLVAVSKTKPPEAVRAAYAAGQRDFGENYVKELQLKAEALTDLTEIRWHVIGHLQRNKARPAVKLSAMIHTIDSTKLAEELGKRAGDAFKDGRRLPVLVEVNVGGEKQKSGCKAGELPGVLAAIDKEASLELCGLMTVPPHTEDPAGARPCFDQLVRLRDENGGVERLPELSMGMTHDLEHAIYAGATIVRVGTAIFGERT